MTYAAAHSNASPMRLRTSQSHGTHMPLQYMPPVEEASPAPSRAQYYEDEPGSPRSARSPEPSVSAAGRDSVRASNHGSVQWSTQYADGKHAANSAHRASLAASARSGSAQPPMPSARTSSLKVDLQQQLDEYNAAEQKNGSDAGSTTGSSEHSVHNDKGYRVLFGKERWGLTIEPFTEDTSYDEGRPRAARIAYLEGLRGIVALQTLLWLFFRVFAPAIVTDTDVDGTRPAAFLEYAPQWQNTLRKVLSPLLFNGTTQAAMFVILIGRCGLQTFVERRQAVNLAGAVFRRPLRILLPVMVTMALISVLTVTNSFKHANFLAADLHNDAVLPPAVWTSALEYFNAVLSLLYLPYAERDTVAVNFIPVGRIAWFVDVAFQQTFALIIFAFTLPYTVFKYKVIGLSSMIVLSAWVGRWSWYTVTGLMLAEFAVVYRSMMPDRAAMATAQRGQRRVSLTPPQLNRVRDVAIWAVPGLMVFVGIVFKYVWIAAVPQYINKELLAHADMNSGKLLVEFSAADRAFPRYDDWFLCTGVLVLVELSEGLQRLLSKPILTWLGRLSFSIALIAGTIMISLGALLHSHLVQTLHWTNPAQIILVEFLAMVPACLLCADWWSRLADDGGLRLSHAFFNFARN